MTVAPPRPIRLRSIRNTEAPWRAAAIAAYMPAPPEPMTRTSVSTCIGSSFIAESYQELPRAPPMRRCIAGKAKSDLFRQRPSFRLRQERGGHETEEIDAGEDHRRRPEAAELDDQRAGE